jgi:tetratricopeptide (TPR) repeat protein
MPGRSTAKVIAIKELMEKRNGSISVCMIARDEEAWIGEALRSVKDLADEMIVVDTGSRDGTMLEAKRCGAKVYQAPWNNDFSEARNLALSKATREWILVLDADEAIAPDDHRAIRSLVRSGERAAYLVEQRTYTSDSTGPCLQTIDRGEEFAGGSETCFADAQIRLFPNDEAIRFACEIHENVEESLLTSGLPIRECEVVLHHFGRIRKTNGAGGTWGLDAAARARRKALIWCALGREGMPAYPAHPRYLYEMASQFLAIGRLEDAVSHARTGLEFEPKSWEFWNLTGLAHLRRREPDKALQCFRHALWLKDDSSEVVNNAGVAFMELGEPAEALIHFERAASLEEGNPEILRNAASACALTGELEHGLEHIGRSIAIDPFTARSHTIHADILCRMGRPAEAAHVLNGMRFLADTPFQIYLKAIQLYTRLGMMVEADRALGSAMGVFPEREDLWYLSAKIAELRGEDERAISDYGRVLSTYPGHADALNSLGCLYERRGRLTDALESFLLALAVRPNDVEIEVNAGIVLDKLGRIEEAGRHFDRVLESGELSGFACNALGCHLARSFKFDEALVYFTRAVDLESTNAMYYRNLGLVCEKMNLPERAARAFEKMAAVDPDSARAAREDLMGIGEPMA